HTRFSRDWSSDVCSSDLALFEFFDSLQGIAARAGAQNAVVFSVLLAQIARYRIEHGGLVVNSQNDWFCHTFRILNFEDQGVQRRSEERRVGKEGRDGWSS